MPDPIVDPVTPPNPPTPGVRSFTDAEFSQETARIHTGGRMEGTRRAVSKIAEVGKKYGVEINSDDPDEVARVLDTHLGKLTAPKGGKGARNGNENVDPDLDLVTRERDALLQERNEISERYERTMLESAINRAIATADVADADLAFAGFTREFQFKQGKGGEIEVFQNGQRAREGYKDLTVAEAFAGWIKNKPVLLKPTNTGGRSATDRGAGSPISAGNYDPKNPPKPGSPEANAMLIAGGMRKA